MNGIIHIGEKQFGGGRTGEGAAKGITEQLVSIGFKAGRMKTGTPPRVDGRSLNYGLMIEQKGDENPQKFSYTNTKPLSHQRSCHITYTNEKVHDILRSGFKDSPLFNGSIQGIGPRYCPSVEDKVNRFAERTRHQIFVEPEGWNTCETYINGFSTSLPQHIQYEALRSIKGFENAKIFRPGYAIEYDFFYPTQLALNLETKAISNLFFAGQINGTTGYEEAACQGLMAGINAHQKINNKDPFVLSRSEAYIGVLIDDLVNKGTNEPYRMFTSRAEYRILLRQDNADQRLMEKGFQLGTVSVEEIDKLHIKENNIARLSKLIKTKTITPKEANPVLIKHDTAEIPQNYLIDKILSRPQITHKHLLEIKTIKQLFEPYSDDEMEQVEILLKYDSYIKSERENVEKLLRLEHYNLESDFNYTSIKSLSLEAIDKLNQIKPTSVGQAARISGVSPADISVLLVHFGR